MFGLRRSAAEVFFGVWDAETTWGLRISQNWFFEFIVSGRFSLNRIQRCTFYSDSGDGALGQEWGVVVGGTRTLSKNS